MAMDESVLNMPTPAELEIRVAGTAATSQQSHAQEGNYAQTPKTSCDRTESAVIPQNSEITDVNEDPNRPKGVRFALLYFCVLLGSFFIGYDTSCVATLTPVITDEYHALNDIGWYAITYLLAQCGTMLIYGQLYTYYSMKNLYEASLCVFCVGSILSATAPTSLAFIIGRALSGLGAGGILAGMNIIVAHTTSLKYRPVFSAITGGVECMALALGPFISGVIARYATWRISFYIIIPASVIAIVVVFFSTGHLHKINSLTMTNKDTLKKIDWVGFGINIPMTLTLVLALQWGGSVYAWRSWRIILLLVLAGSLVVVFLFWERKLGEGSMVPLKMLRQRTVALASIITFCDFAHLSVVAYYLPLYFQAVRGASTFESGLMYLPLAATLGIIAFVGGPLTTWLGYYNPVLYLGGIFSAVGAGLLTTLEPNSSAGKWITFQVIYAIGIGLAFQPPYLAVQTLLADTLVPTALVMLSYAQQLGGVVALAIAQNVFLNKLSHNLNQVQGLDAGTLTSAGALGVVRSAPPQIQGEVLLAYNSALKDVLYIVLALACLVGVCMFGLEWRSVKGKKEEKKDEVKTEKRTKR